MKKPVIYTIGHSTHPQAYFLELLNEYSINCLVDVRSIAASSYNPQYNKESLSDFLKANGITYLHFAEEFGARQSDPKVLDHEGRVDFIKVQKSVHFKRGVERLWQGIEKQFTITLMCSESNPMDCHRFSMISTALEKYGFQIRHILKDKTVKTTADLEHELLKKYTKRIPKPDIFSPAVSVNEQLKVAYRLQNEEIGFLP